MIKLIEQVRYYPPTTENKTTYEIARDLILSLKRYEDALISALKSVKNQYVELALIITGKEVLNNGS